MILIPLLFAAAAARPTAVPPARPIAKAVTACLAVTRADVQFALGRSVSLAQPAESATQSTCDYATESARVTITLQRLDHDVDLPVEIAALQKEIEGSTVRPAAAAGPQSFFLDIAGAGTQLHVIRGREYLLVSVLGFGDASQVASAALRLAFTALRRM